MITAGVVAIILLVAAVLSFGMGMLCLFAASMLPVSRPGFPGLGWFIFSAVLLFLLIIQLFEVF